MQQVYVSDQLAELLPAGGIYIYLNELPTSKNLLTNEFGKLVAITFTVENQPRLK